VDLALSELQEVVSRNRLFGTGYVTLISAQGNVIASCQSNITRSTAENMADIATAQPNGTASVRTLSSISTLE